MQTRISSPLIRTLMVLSLTLAMAVSNIALAVFTPFATSTADAALIQPGPERAPSVGPAGNLDQCRNGTAASPNDCLDNGGASGWVNGNVGASQAHLAEGYAIPYRLRLTNLTPGAFTVDLSYDILQNDRNAIDYLMSYQWLDDPSHSLTFGHGAECVDPPDGVFAASNGSCDPGTPTSTYAIPKPSLPVSAVSTKWDAISAAGKTRMAAWNATITGIEYVSQGDLAAGGTQETRIRVYLTVAADISTAVLAWGGHIARQQEWGVGLSASAITGSPYHMRLKGFCTGSTATGALCQDGGNQDRSLSADAVYAPPMLTLVKTVTNDNGGTALVTAWTLTATGPNTISGASGSATVTNANVAAGTYTLSESGGPAGYAAGSWSCVKNGGGAVTGSSITLANDDVATCTINNNDIAATHLTLVKSVTNDNGGTALATAWTLSASGATPISGTSGSAAVTSAVVTPGTYTLSESGGPTGYTAGSWSCVKNGGAPATGSSVTLATGDSATCTVTNDDTAPQLHLRKLVTSDNGGSAAITDWTLTATGASASPTNLSGATPVDSGTGFKADTYTLGETGPSGYAGTWSCGTAPMVDATHIAVGLGDNITCTITNNDNAAQIIVIKHVVNDNGGTAAASAWTMAITGVTTSGSSTFAGAESPGVTRTLTTVGEYSVDESGGPSGYSASYSADCTGTIALGETKTCTITNDDIAPKLHLRKVVVNDNGGTALKTAWTLTATGALASPTNLSGTDPVDSGAGFKADTYTLAETGGATGYSASGWSCVKNTATLAAILPSSSVTLGVGEEATCTITNDDIAAHLIVIKHVINDNDGSENSASAWTMTINGVTAVGGTSFAGAESPGVDKTLTSVGGYSVTEDGPANYTPSYSADCTGTIALGQTKTCTVTNDDNAPGLHLRKIIVNDNGGTAAATDWTLTATGTTTLSGTTPVDSDATFVGGTYTLSESGGPAGYTASSWVCVGGTQRGSSVTVALGDSVTCTITNDDIAPALHLRKTVTNDNGGSAVASDWTLSATGPTPIGGATPVDSGTTFAAGTYALAEGSGPAGYTAGTWSCGEATMTDATHVVVGLGDDITCTIANNDDAAHLIVIKHVVGGQNVAGDFTMTIDGVTATGGQSFAGQESPGTDKILTTIGDYTVNETGLPRYSTFYSPDCTGTIALGETKTCTVTNTFIPDNPTGNLTVTKYNDANGNGTRDAGEPALAGWTFALSVNGFSIGTMTTDATGSATRYGLAPGTYTLVETLQTGWTSTDPGTATPTKVVVVAANQTSTVLFGNREVIIPPTSQGGTIAVTKYEDANSSKARDAGEAGLSGWVFTIRNDQGTVVATITTDANGLATAVNLQPGVYTVTETTQTGWVSTDPGGSAPSKQVLVDPGQTIAIVFGNAKVQLPSTSTEGPALEAYAMLALALALGFISIRRSRTQGL